MVVPHQGDPEPDQAAPEGDHHDQHQEPPPAAIAHSIVPSAVMHGAPLLGSLHQPYVRHDLGHHVRAVTRDHAARSNRAARWSPWERDPIALSHDARAGLRSNTLTVWGSRNVSSETLERGAWNSKAPRDFLLPNGQHTGPYERVELRTDNAHHHFTVFARRDSRTHRRTRLPAPGGPRPVRPRTYSVPEVAVILGIGRSTADALAQRGELAALRVGGRVVVARAEIDRLLGDDPAA